MFNRPKNKNDTVVVIRKEVPSGTDKIFYSENPK